MHALATARPALASASARSARSAPARSGSRRRAAPTAAAGPARAPLLRAEERRRLVESHMPLVRSLASRMERTARPYLELDDLVSIGAEALLRASERFDPSRSVAFSSFVYLRVRGAMMEGLGQVGPHTRGTVRRRAGRADRPAPPPPTAFDDARRHGATRRELCEALAHALDRARLGPRLCSALTDLDPAGRTMIERHYFAGESLQDIGRALGISKSWASRIHARALARLRAALEPGEGAPDSEPPSQQPIESR